MGRSEDNTSGSEDWGGDGWTVDCPCGINFDDGEEMVECDACRVWVHTRCCRVPKGLTHYVCERCRDLQQKKQVREDVEVAALLADLPSARSSPLDEASRSPFLSNSSLSYSESGLLKLSQQTLTLQSQPSFDEGAPYDIPLAQRVHTHGVTGGEQQTLPGAPSFSKHLWRHQLMVPKPLDLQPEELSVHLLLDVDPPELHGQLPRAQGQQPVRRGAQAKAERRRRLMEVVERYEERRRRRLEDERSRGAVLNKEEFAQAGVGSWSESEGKSLVDCKPLANGNAYAPDSSDLASPGGTSSWTAGYIPRNPYALKKAAILEYMHTSQSRCASCDSSEALSWHEVKGLEGSVCDACAARHGEQKFCPYCVHIYQKDEEQVADPRVWLVCTTCARLVHRECQAKKPLNGTGPVKRSTFLCSGFVRERKKSRHEGKSRSAGRPLLLGEKAGVDLFRAAEKSAAVLRLEDHSSLHSVHTNGYDVAGIGLEDECSRPGGSFDKVREASVRAEAWGKAALKAAKHSEALKAEGLGEAAMEVGKDGQTKEGSYAQRRLLVTECYPSSPKAKKAAAVALAQRLAAQESEEAEGVAGKDHEVQETDEAAGVPTPSGPEPELQRRDSEPGSTSVKNGEAPVSGGEGTVESGSRKFDNIPSSLLINAVSALEPQVPEKVDRPGSPSPSSSSNSSSSQARDSAAPPLCQQPGAALASQPLADPAGKVFTPWAPLLLGSSDKVQPGLPASVRPKALSLPLNGKKLLDFPDTPGSVTSEHKPSQGAAQPLHLTPSGRLIPARPSHPGVRPHRPEGAQPLSRHALPNGSLKKEVPAAPAIPKGMAEMPPPPPPVAPKCPARSASDLPPMNDEELALLLHQELNSSPRMPRVSRSKKTAGNGGLPSKRHNSSLAMPLRRTRSGEEMQERRSSSKQESDEAEPTAGEVQSPGVPKVNGRGPRVKIEAEEEELLTTNGIRSVPELIEELGLISTEGSLEHVVDIVCKHWHTLRKTSGEPYPPLQRQAVLEALSSRDEWAYKIKQGLPTKRKRTSPPAPSDSEGKEELNGRAPNGFSAGKSPAEEETTEGGGPRIAKKKRSRRAALELSDTSEPEREDPSSSKPLGNGNGNHKHANGHLHPDKSSSGRSSHSGADEEEALSQRHGPPRRKRSRLDARSVDRGVRQSGGSGTPEED